MQLKHLSLTNYRNFARLETDIPEGITLLTGANAQGKTNLLEAIHFLSRASSPHARDERQLINFLALQDPSPFMRLAAEVQRRDRSHRIEIRLLLDPPDGNGERRIRKQIMMNGVKRRLHDLFGVFSAVLFFPQDLRVLEGPPAERRRFLDAALVQADPHYTRTLMDYGKVLSQRNALLKQLNERSGSPDQLSFWNERLIDLASDLICARALALYELETLGAPIHQRLTPGGETLRIEYLPACNPISPPAGQLGLPLDETIDWASMGKTKIGQRLRVALFQSREEEIARGATLVGPHRDDFLFNADGIDLRSFGSRGQNRTAMLAVKLAQVDWLRGHTGHWPVLLLDEVLAELDTERRTRILERVSQARQAVLTTSDLSMFSQRFQQGALIWRIRSGTITKIDS